MAYKLLYNDELLFDPYSDNIVTDAQLTSKYNNPDYFDFTVPITNDLYNKLSERSGSVKLFYDNEKIFDGIITSIDVDMDGNKSVKCSGPLDYLNDTLVRPYATTSGESQTLAPDTVSGIFQWYIDQHNQHTMDSRKHFSVGVNQGAMLSENNAFSRKSDSLPTTWNEIKNAILEDHGGFIFVEYSGDSNVLNLYGDIHESNAQIIDFGVNITDFSKTTDTADQYTAIRPSGYTPEAPKDNPDNKMYPITISDLPDNPVSSDLVKKSDIIYSISAVKRYGYKEYAYSNNDITDTNNLLKSAAVILKTLISPAETITVKAIDLALYMNGYKHLRVGQAVRIRSKIHSTDEYMMVNSIVLDINDPSNTEYEFGIPYDTLTGQQSSYLKNLNSSINSAIDSVAGLDQISKDTAKKAEDAKNTANVAKDTANTAQNTANSASSKADKAQSTANNAQNTANNAQQTSNANKQSIADIEKQQSEQDKLIEQMQAGVEQAEQEIGGINDRLDQMDTEAGEVQASIDAVRQEAQTNFETAQAAADSAGKRADAAQKAVDSLRESTSSELQNVKDSVSGVRSDVDAVTQQAADLASEMDGTKATVEQVVTEQGVIKTTVSNAVEKVDQSLQVSTQASQTATQAQTTATSAYRDAQSALTQSSTASQTANAVKTELETNYSTTDEIAEQYATKSLVEQTSQSITSTVEATYATKATVEALENIANNAVQTWMGSGVPTLSNKPASDWTTAELKSQHSGDLYYDTVTGYAYRFGSSDGTSYSWALVKDTDITKALSDAAKAQQTAEGVSDEVTQLKTDIPATYATKTEVKQTTDSIKSSVSEVATTANSALSKATTVEQTANGLQTTVTEQAKKLDGAVTTISQVSQRVDSVSSTITQEVERLDSTSQNFITNPQFKQGNVDGVANTNMNATDSNPGALPGTATTFGKNFSGYDNRAENVRIKFVKNHTYRIEIDARLASDNAYTGTEGLGLFFWFMSADNPGLSNDQFTDYSNLIPSGTKEWTHASYDYTPTMGDNDPRIIFRPAYRVAPSSRWLVTNFTCTDVTAIAEAQKDADTATSTANSALSKSSSVEQNLNSFKTSVSRDYQTKTDALSQKSELEQNINSFKTTVSETYETKTHASDTYLDKNAASSTYTSKTEFKQTTDKISATATAASQNASSALSKVSELEVSVDGIDTRVEENAKAIDQNVKTTSQVSQRVDSLSSTITQVQGDIDRIDANSQNFITNPQFKSGNADGVQNTLMEASDSNAGKLPGTATTYGKSTSGYDNRAENVKIKGIPGHTYRIEIDAKRASDNTDTSAAEGLGLFFWYFTEDNPGLSSNGFTSYNVKLIPASVTDWTHGTYDYVFPSNSNIKVIRPAYRTPPSKHWLVTNFTCTDVTAIAEAQKDADTATSTANSALSKSSSVEQNLNSFKTSVQQTYETKADASSKQSSLQQSVNNLRTEVSETYTTKTDFTNLNNAATKTYQFHADVGQTGWYKLGTWSNTNQSDVCAITIYAGNGQNGQPYQNREVRVFIKDGYQSTPSASGAFGVTIDRIRNADNAEVQVRATAANSCDVWYKGDTTYAAGRYTISIDPSSKWTHSGSFTTSAPSSGTLQTQEYQTYSTKSYVDQTARTVSLGVVEEYKNGKHGSALTTQSDITAAKDSITSTVSKTYATKTEVEQTYATKTAVKQTSDSLTVTISSAVSKAESAATAASKAQNTANTANRMANTANSNAQNAQSTANAANTNAATARSTADKAIGNAQNAQNRVGNLETCIKMSSDGVRVGKISNGNFTGYSALVNSAGSFDILNGSGAAVTRFTTYGMEIPSSNNGNRDGKFVLTSSGYDLSFVKNETTYYFRLGSGGIGIHASDGSYVDIGSGGLAIHTNNGNYVDVSPNGTNITSSDGSYIAMSKSSGFNLESKAFGTLRCGPNGLQFTNDQGWGLSLSIAGWSLKWAGNHTLSTGNEAGALYIDGRKIQVA